MVTAHNLVSININRKPLTRIHSCPDTNYYLHKNSFNNFDPFPCRSIASYAFCKSINAQNTSFSFAWYFSHTYLTANTRCMHALPCLKPRCSSPIAHSVPALNLNPSTLPYIYQLHWTNEYLSSYYILTCHLSLCTGALYLHHASP